VSGSGGAKDARAPRLLRQLLAWRPKTGKVLAVALYITEKELRASADTVAAMKEELIPQAGGRLVSVDEYEVIAQEPGTGGS
jgi:hypothetical protein